MELVDLKVKKPSELKSQRSMPEYIALDANEF